MIIVSKLCETELLDYFEARRISMIHIILEASKDVTIQRIKNDCIRDQAAQSQQVANVEWQIKRHGRPDGTIYVIFQFCLPAVSSFVFHIFFIGFCFLSGRHGFFQTIFPADTITELASA